MQVLKQQVLQKP